MLSSSEAKIIAALFMNAKAAILIRYALINMGQMKAKMIGHSAEEEKNKNDQTF